MDGLGRQQPIKDSVYRAAVGVAMDPGQMLYRQAVTQLSSVDEESGLAEGGFNRPFS